MGEAKRRGNYQERVSQAMERAQSRMTTKLEADIRLREHLQQLEARRAQMANQMGPMDKLYVDQHHMLQEAAQKLKQMEGVQVITETDDVMVVSIASQESLGTTIVGECLGRGETTVVTPIDEVAILNTPSPELNATPQGGIPANQVFVISSETDSSHFDDLAPIVVKETTNENSQATTTEAAP